MKHLKIFLLVTLCLLVGASAFTWQHNERDYALSEAASREDIAQIQKLLDAGANPNALWSGYDLKATAYHLVGRDPFDGGPVRQDYRIVRWTQNPKIRQLLIKHGARP